MSYGIIKKHQGFILVASEEGKGTTFTIRLPINHPENSQQQKVAENIQEGDAA